MLKVIVFIVSLVLITSQSFLAENVQDDLPFSFEPSLKPSPMTVNPEASRSLEEIVILRGYPLETHFVTTKDGYILKVYRIPGAKGSLNVNEKPVLLQHGLVDSADSFILHKEEKSYSYHLANNGFDVWIGNSRGNKHSRGHTKFDAEKDAAFWDFTYHEMGIYDLPAVLDYIKVKTGKKVTYIGHSQGSTQVFIGMSLMPEYFKDSLTGVIALGPAAALANMGSSFLQFVAKTKFDVLLYSVGVKEFVPSRPVINKFYSWVCDTFHLVCNSLLEMLADSNAQDDDQETFPVFMGHFPSGTSVKDLTHFAQNVRSKVFAQYDYGATKNMQIYNQTIAPEYNLTKIQNKVCLFVGKDDILATPTDSRILNQTLTKAGMAHFYNEYDNMGHITFFLPKDFTYNNDLMNCIHDFTR